MGKDPAVTEFNPSLVNGTAEFMYIICQEKLPCKLKNKQQALKVFVAAINKSFIWDMRIISDMYELDQCHW